jgi:hypothetical protein
VVALQIYNHLKESLQTPEKVLNDYVKARSSTLGAEEVTKYFSLKETKQISYFSAALLAARMGQSIQNYKAEEVSINETNAILNVNIRYSSRGVLYDKLREIPFIKENGDWKIDISPMHIVGVTHKSVPINYRALIKPICYFELHP